MPALLTSTSSLPKSRSVDSIAAAQFAAGNKSVEINPQDAPDFCSSICNCFPASASLSTRMGIPPSCAQPRPMAAPMPLAPPVITTTLPLSCKSMWSHVQFVKSCGVAAEELLLIGFGVSFHVFLHELVNLTI